MAGSNTSFDPSGTMTSTQNLSGVDIGATPNFWTNLNQIVSTLRPRYGNPGMMSGSDQASALRQPQNPAATFGANSPFSVAPTPQNRFVKLMTTPGNAPSYVAASVDDPYAIAAGTIENPSVEPPPTATVRRGSNSTGWS